MSRPIAALSILVSALLGACSATNEVNDITGLAPGSHVAGIPFRLADHYRVHVLQLQSDGTYKDVFITTQDMPDQSHIFAVNFKGDAFSDNEFKVELNDDNTLKTTHLKSTQHVTDTIGAVADQAAAVNTAIRTQTTAEGTALSSCLTARETFTNLLGAAEVAEAQYNATLANPGSTDVATKTAYQAMVLAKQKAADQAILIAHSPPCPNN